MMFWHLASFCCTGVRKKTKAKWSDASSHLGVIVDAEKVKPSVLLLTGARKGIRPVKLCTETHSHV